MTAGNGAGPSKALTDAGKRACKAASQAAHPIGNCLTTGYLAGTLTELRSKWIGMSLLTPNVTSAGTPRGCGSPKGRWDKPDKLPPRCALASGSAVA